MADTSWNHVNASGERRRSSKTVTSHNVARHGGVLPLLCPSPAANFRFQRLFYPLRGGEEVFIIIIIIIIVRGYTRIRTEGTLKLLTLVRAWLERLLRLARACTKGTVTYLTLCFGRRFYPLEDSMQYSARLWMFKLWSWHCEHRLRPAESALVPSGVANSRLLTLAR
jgi:hypothetical protein